MAKRKKKANQERLTSVSRGVIIVPYPLGVSTGVADTDGLCSQANPSPPVPFRAE